MVAITALVFGIIEGPAEGWGSPLVVSAFVIAAVFGAAFIWIERRVEHPMLNLDYFRNPRFSGGALAISVAFFSLFGVIFLLTQYLQFVLGYSALEAGVRTAPIALGMVIGSAMSPRLAERYGTTKVVAFGLFVLSATLVSFTFLSVTTGYAIIGVSIVAMAFGMGNIMAPSTDAVMGAVPVAKAGVGSATNDVTRQVAGAIGVAVIGSVFNSAYQSNMEPAVAQLPPEAAGAAGNSIGAALQVAAQLPGQAGEALAIAARQGFVDAMGVATWIPVGVAFLAALLVLRFLPPQHLPPAEEPGAARSSAPVAQESA
jgi:predicted MFS family arabinose efflux permease